jgi:hypothetical protein
MMMLCGCSTSSPGAAESADGGVETAPASCNFNDECPDGQRCDCQLDACTCQSGARGSGRSGVDSCASGVDCISGLCVEGPAGFVCSGRCSDGCGDKLPRCANISPLGEICVREPPATPSGAKGTFGSDTFEFAHAFFGYDYGDAGPVGATIELHAGWSGGCPPPKTDPDATIVVAGVPVPFAAKVYDSGIKATLLGFDPRLPIKSTATSTKVEIKSIESCLSGGACALDLDVSFAFAEGAVRGAVRATHCDSMDRR